MSKNTLTAKYQTAPIPAQKQVDAKAELQRVRNVVDVRLP